MKIENNNPSNASQADNSGSPTPQAGTSSGQVPNETPTIDVEVLQHLLKEARQEAAANRVKANELQKAADTTKREQEAAREQQLAEQGQFKTLAEQHATRVKELEPIAARHETLSSLISEQIKDEIKDWPASIKALDPGKDAPVEQRLEWRNKARAIVAEMTQQARTAPGNSPNPRPSQQSVEDIQTRHEKDLRRGGKYSM